MAFTALFDACALYPVVRDVLLSLAQTRLFRARWTARIQHEWVRSLLVQYPEREAALRRTLALMEQIIPDAAVTGYETLEDCLELPDPTTGMCWLLQSSAGPTLL
jgi:hypothetical protein